VLKLIRSRLTYSNTMATLALFIALGGTSYALTLPRGSVGARELKTGAVTSRDVRDRGVALRDISRSARRALRGATGRTGPAGPQGPGGVTFFAAVNSGGAPVAGNATRSTDRGVNGRVLYFARSVDSCGYSATLAHIAGGLITDPPPGSTITVASSGDGGVLVRTWDGANAATPLPFHLIVAC
jgi:hypothetical protein